MLNQFETFTPLISICIPTYNRSDKVYDLVTSILSYPNTEIEVLVLDNCSTDNTYKVLTSITDSRFTLYKNSENIGGIMSPLKVITLAKGRFSFLCLDKDLIDHNYLQELVKSITYADANNISFGVSALNAQTNSDDVVFSSGEDALLGLAYLSRHPTGFFYKTALFNNLTVLKEWFIKKERFSFYFDIINAEMAMRGKGLIINKTVFFTEKETDAAKKPSLTYDANSLYFSPESRLGALTKYIDHLQTLGLAKQVKFRSTKKIFRQELLLATFGYRNMMKNPYVCAHHLIAPQKIGLPSLFKSAYTFSKHFLDLKMGLNLISKGFIICESLVIMLVRSILVILNLK